jgi:hypothetical protein
MRIEIYYLIKEGAKRAGLLRMGAGAKNTNGTVQQYM